MNITDQLNVKLFKIELFVMVVFIQQICLEKTSEYAIIFFFALMLH